MKWIILFFESLWELTVEMSPYLLLGFFIAGLLNGLLSKDWLQSQLGKPGILSSIKASLFGVPLPLCSCGVIPTGVSLYKNGASKGAATSFLISTPQTGIDSILITYGLMGWMYAVVRPVIAFITGIFGGCLVDHLDEKHKVISDKSCETCDEEENHKNWFERIFKYAFVDFLQDISKWLVIGLVLASLISIIVPDDFFEHGIFSEPILSILLVLAASIPLYVCATGSVPIAAVLLMKGISPGAAVVFLMAGPATNIATFTVLWKTLGKRATLAYLFTIIGGAICFGIVIDYVIPTSWQSLFLITDYQESHHHILPKWISVTSAVVLIVLMLNAEIQRYMPKKSKISATPTETMQSFKIKGMTCNHCVNSVKTSLKELGKVKDVSVNLTTGKIDVMGPVKVKEVQTLVEKLGYQFVGKL